MDDNQSEENDFLSSILLTNRSDLLIVNKHQLIRNGCETNFSDSDDDNDTENDLRFYENHLAVIESEIKESIEKVQKSIGMENGIKNKGGNANNKSLSESEDVSDTESYKSTSSSFDEDYYIAEDTEKVVSPNIYEKCDILPKIKNKYEICCNKLIIGSFPSSRPTPFQAIVWPLVLKSVTAGNLFNPDSVFIEKIVENESRDCLAPKKRRRELLESLKPLVEMSPNEEEIVVKLISAIIQYHSRMMEGNCGICRLGKFHDILYVGNCLALEYDIKDSLLVSDLIKAMYLCEGGLDRIIVPAVLGPKLSHVLSGWYPDYDNVHIARNALVYFVNHAMRTKLLLPGPSGELLRVLDTPLVTLQGAPPLTAAVQCGDLEAVAMLLTYGSKLSFETMHCPLRSLLSKLSTHARARFSLRKDCACSRSIINGKQTNTEAIHPLNELESFFQEINSQDTFELCPCELNWKIDWPEQDLSILKLLMSSINCYRFVRHPEILHPKIVTDKLIDISPRSLMQLCSLSIRERIHQNWCLPHGVYDLNLPSKLINYITLTNEVYR